MKEEERCRTCKYLRARSNGKDVLPILFCKRSKNKWTVTLDCICMSWESMEEYKMANRIVSRSW